MPRQKKSCVTKGGFPIRHFYVPHNFTQVWYDFSPGKDI